MIGDLVLPTIQFDELVDEWLQHSDVQLVII